MTEQHIKTTVIIADTVRGKFIRELDYGDVVYVGGSLAHIDSICDRYDKNMTIGTKSWIAHVDPDATIAYASEYHYAPRTVVGKFVSLKDDIVNQDIIIGNIYRQPYIFMPMVDEISPIYFYASDGVRKWAHPHRGYDEYVFLIK